MNLNSLSATTIKDFLKAKGASIVGIADLSELERTFGLREKELRKYSRAISIGLRLNDEIINGISKGPTAEYAQHYREINSKLDYLTEILEEKIKSKGFKAKAIPGSKGYDKQELAAEFPHKTAAVLSGLGWIGKSALLISFEHGSRVRFGTVLTNAPFEADKAQRTSNCKECMACVTACPAQAIIGKNWKFGMEREEMFNAFKCYDHLKIQEKKVGETICGICVNVCPYGKR